MDYLDFTGGILLARIARDMKSPCCAGNDPQLWLDIELENIEADKIWTPEEKQQLRLTAMLAELLDDRKAWLLEELREDLKVAV